MGLCTAGATFQRAMSLVLRGLQRDEVIVFLDDVIVLDTNFNNAYCRLIAVSVSDTFIQLHEVVLYSCLHVRGSDRSAE